MSTTVYVGYPLGDGRWVGITQDRAFVTGRNDSDIQPVGGWGDHPLATVSGVEMLLVFLNIDTEWRALTKAQQRCLMNPETRTRKPWQALTAKGLVDADGLRTEGWFLRLAIERIHRRNDGVETPMVTR